MGVSVRAPEGQDLWRGGKSLERSRSALRGRIHTRYVGLSQSAIPSFLQAGARTRVDFAAPSGLRARAVRKWSLRQKRLWKSLCCSTACLFDVYGFVALRAGVNRRRVSQGNVSLCRHDGGPPAHLHIVSRRQCARNPLTSAWPNAQPIPSGQKARSTTSLRLRRARAGPRRNPRRRE